MSSASERTIELLNQLVNSKKNLADTLVEKGEEASVTEPFDDLVEKAGNYIPKTYILTDEEGNEVVGTLVAQETVFDVEDNDVREGKIYAGEKGMGTGTKKIPAYHTTAGYRLIANGSVFKTYALTESNKYDFTRFQAIICPYNESISTSVAADKVAIEESVYNVNSSDVIASVIKDSETQTINLGFTNDSGIPYVLRYFTYKEIE